MCAMTVGELNAYLNADTSRFDRALDSAERRFRGFGDRMSRGTAMMGRVALVGAATGVTAIGGALAYGAVKGIKFNSSIEQTTISMTTMLGSTKKAKDLIGQVTKMAAATPFEFPELADATKRLIAYGVSETKVVDTMRRLGDVASGLSIPLGEISDVYGKIKVQGRVFMEDINQLSGRGIPIYEALAEVLGVNESKIRDMVTEGKIGFPQIQKAFEVMTNKGGKFAGMMEAQSKSFSGQWSTIMDTLSQVFGKITKPMFDWLVSVAFPTAIDMANRFSEALDKGKGLGGALRAVLPKNLRDDFDRISGVLSDVAEGAKTAGSLISDMVSKGLKPAQEAAGILKDSLQSVLDLVKAGDWEGLGTGLGQVLKNGLGKIGDLMTWLWDAFKKIDWFEVGAKIGAVAIPMLVGFFSGLFDPAEIWKMLKKHWLEVILAGAALLFTPAKFLKPLLKVVARIPIVGKLLATILGNINKMGGPIRTWMKELWQSFAHGFRSTFSAGAAGRIGKWLVGFLKKAWHSVSNWFGDMSIWIRLKGMDLMEALGRGIGATPGKIKSVIALVINKAITWLLDRFKWLKEAVALKWSDITGVIKGAAEKIVGFINRIIDAVNWVIEKVPGIGKDVVPKFNVSGTRPNGGTGAATPAVMPNGGTGEKGGMLARMFGKLGIPWPSAMGGMFGGVTGWLLSSVKDAIFGLFKKGGGGVGAKIIEYAKSMLGVPYLWGGTSPRGFDCSGLIYWAYKQAGKDIPRTGMWNAGRRVTQATTRPGDVMFYYPNNSQGVKYGHVKMYAGGNQTIESTSGGVQMRMADWAGAQEIRTYLGRGGITRGLAIAGELGSSHPEAVIPLTNPRRGAAVMKAAGLTPDQTGGKHYHFTNYVTIEGYNQSVDEILFDLEEHQMRRNRSL